MATFQYRDEVFRDTSEAFQQMLKDAHASKARPLCICREDGVSMYVAKTASGYCIKRMPGTGALHSAGCDSFEPPPEVSGLGQLLGNAIVEHPDEGVTALKLDFSLSKRPGAKKRTEEPPEPTNTSKADSVATEGNKLSLRSLLHCLWEHAAFHRWSPAMAGKRSWGVVRKHLLTAAHQSTVRGANLADRLFIPEPWRADDEQNIRARRVQQFRPFLADKGPRPLMIVIGEVKEVGPSRYGFRLTLKHLPDVPLLLEPDIHRKLADRFAYELKVWSAFDDIHLVAIATVWLQSPGVINVEQIALMTVTAGWIPFEGACEKEVIDGLAMAGRHFFKGLRYNVAANRPIATAVMTDTEVPTAMYVVDAQTSEDYESALQELLAHSGLAPWVWRLALGPMPDFDGPGHLDDAGHAAAEASRDPHDLAPKPSQANDQTAALQPAIS